MFLNKSKKHCNFIIENNHKIKVSIFISNDYVNPLPLFILRNKQNTKFNLKKPDEIN